MYLSPGPDAVPASLQPNSCPQELEVKSLAYTTRSTFLAVPSSEIGIRNVQPLLIVSARGPAPEGCRSCHFQFFQSRRDVSILPSTTAKAKSRSALNGRNTVDPSFFSEKGITADPISRCVPRATKIVRSP